MKIIVIIIALIIVSVLAPLFVRCISRNKKYKAVIADAEKIHENAKAERDKFKQAMDENSKKAEEQYIKAQKKCDKAKAQLDALKARKSRL